MNEYTDIKVVECNRLHSEEAKSNNNENFALWTNNLQDIIHLNPGDKVSVQGAMISERGAGQPTSIEIKGESLGIKKQFSTIEVTNKTTNASVAARRIDNSDEQIATFKSVTKEIFDNKGYFTMNYFVPANGHNYIDLPRRFWYSEEAGGFGNNNYVTNDSQSKGMSFADPFGKLDTYTATTDAYDLYEDYYQVSGLNTNSSLSKVKKDNARYTIMIREHTYNSSEAMAPNVGNEQLVPPQYLRTPEHHTYRILRELKEIDAPLGFNSPDYLATEITRQLQKVESSNVFNYRDGDDIYSDNIKTPGFPIPITKSISTKTYKPFNVARYMGALGGGTPTAQELKMLEFVNASNTLTDGWDYLNQYTIIGCKRPELYEFGRLINRNHNLTLSLTKGSQLQGISHGEYIDTNITYTNANILKDFKNFIEAQAKYPEIWNMFSDSRTDYNGSDTIDNSRWVHINRFPNASMTLYNGSNGTTIINTAPLGWGGYTYPTWNASKVTMKSVILPIEYDSTQAETYYAQPDEKAGERTYGAFGRNTLNNIRIYLTKHNGKGSALFNMLKYPGLSYIESTRKIGFDQHFSAPGMTYILPCDMRPDPTAVLKKDDYTESTNLNGYAQFNLSPYSDVNAVEVAQLYFGANAPALNWNGANFTISSLHTAMNTGNNFLAGNPTGEADNLYARQSNGEGDVVYKINPREDFCDFTPARKPYLGQITLKSYTPTPPSTIATSYFNQNLEAWRVYDCLTGIMIEDFGLEETEWTNSLWGLLGFSYKQFHSASNTRLSVVDFNNANDLSIVTTNAEINEGDTKLYTQNMFGTPLFYNRLPFGGTINNKDSNDAVRYLPEIIQKTQSIEIIADKLPTRMIRGYYTIRSNILQNTPFVGGKLNNTIMPIIGVVNKVNNYGDFVFGEESSLVFTITKPLKLASLTCSIHDPDGSYARCSEQSTILFKIQKDLRVSFNVIQDILQEQEQQKKK
jgi:hypothetical protein